MLIIADCLEVSVGRHASDVSPCVIYGLDIENNPHTIAERPLLTNPLKKPNVIFLMVRTSTSGSLAQPTHKQVCD